MKDADNATTVENISRLAQEHATRAFAETDQVTRGIKREFETHANVFDLTRYLADTTADVGFFTQIGVVDASGLITASSLPMETPINIRDREHFAVHAAKDTGQFFISKPVLGRVSQKWTIQCSRRLNHANGAFAGVVVVSLDTEYFSRFYRDLKLGQRGSIALVGADKIVRARQSGFNSLTAQDVSRSELWLLADQQRAGSYRAASKIDSEPRLFHFRALNAYPLLVNVGVSEIEMGADLRTRRGQYLLALSVLTITLLAIAYFIARVISRERAVQTMLRTTANATLLFDERGTILFANDALQSLFGYTESDLLGKNISMLQPAAASLGKWQEIARDSAGGDRMFNWLPAPLSARRRDGREFPIEVTFSNMRSSGKELSGGYIQDISGRAALENSLRASEQRYELALKAAHDGMWDHNLENGAFLFAGQWKAHLGYADDELDNDAAAFLEQLHPDDVAPLREALIAHLKHRVPFTPEVRLRAKSGGFRYVRLAGQAMWNRQGRAVRMAGVVSDITERRAARDALFEEKERAQVTLRSIGDAVITTDLAGTLQYLNPAAEQMTGWRIAHAAGLPLSDVFCIINDVTRAPAQSPVEVVLRKHVATGLISNCLLVRQDGTEAAIGHSASPIHNQQGDVTGAVLVFHDVTDARSMALHMAHLAQHDSLTGLPNRMLLDDRLGQAIGHAKRHHTQSALLFLDLDRFKSINDLHGHAMGDKLLREVARRLQERVRSNDTVCRQGGDEFVVLLSEVDHAESASEVAHVLMGAIAEPFEIEGQHLSISVSIGGSMYPADGADVDALVKAADVAMYAAKDNGRHSVQFFTDAMNQRTRRRAEIEARLRYALPRQEFSLHYQPKMNLLTGSITGMEALLRWQHGVQGAIPPAQFIPVAEEFGLIGEIGSWALREACRQNRAWQDAGLPCLPVAVNVSALQFRHDDFPSEVAMILLETKLAPEYLELELTESVLMNNADASIEVLLKLQMMGVRVSADDFGTGYSSLSYLKRFPLDTIKIDRSFVRDITTDPNDAAITCAIISMAKNLNRKVIAEGAETHEQIEFLRKNGCDETQGYYYCRPLPAIDFARFLRDGTVPARVQLVPVSHNKQTTAATDKVAAAE